MAVRYTSTFYDTYNGQEYTVELWDSAYVGASRQVELAQQGFELQVMQQGDEIAEPIKATQCRVHFKITQDTNGNNLLTFLTSTLLNNKEDRFTIAIFKGARIWWYGVILPDIGTMQDSSIAYDYVVTATDGIGRLKDFDFNPAFAGGTNSVVSFKDIIYECLKLTPLYNTTETQLFSTVVEWYEDLMPARTGATDPLDQAYIDTNAFTRIEEAQRVPFSVYETLEAICKAWHMRLIFSNGIYRFIQIGAYEQVSTTYERFYLRASGNYDTNLAFADEVEINVSPNSLPRVLAGNQWEYFPPLKSVYIRFPFTNANMLNVETALPYTQTLPDNIVGGTGIRLVFTTSVFISVTDAAWSAANGVNATVKIKIKLGTSYYLFKDTLTATNEWTSTSTDRARFGKTTGSKFFEFPISFITDEIPSGTYNNNEFSIEVEEVVDTNSPTSLTFSAIRISGTTLLKYAANTEDNVEFLYYEVQNTATQINSKDIEEPDAIMGEMFNPAYFGSLFTGNTSSWNPSTGLWRIKDTGTAYNFILLRLREIMASQTIAIPKYQGGIVGATSINPHTLVTYDGTSYIMNGATFTAGTGTWDGEWFKVDYNRASVVDIADDTNEDGGDSNGTLRRSIGEVSNQLDNFSLKGGSVRVRTLSADTTIEAMTADYIVNGGYTITLPPAADWILFNGSSIQVFIKNGGGVGDVVTVQASGSETIDGSNSKTLPHYKGYSLISDGTEIFIKAHI